jgi:hypothetical protein
VAKPRHHVSELSGDIRGDSYQDILFIAQNFSVLVVGCP